MTLVPPALDASFLAAAAAFVELVDRVPAGMLAEPALGTWNLRDLIGHTTRALRTVAIYLDRPADRIERADAIEYFEACRDPANAPVVAARGVASGRELGDDVPAGVRLAFDDVVTALGHVRDTDPVIETAAGGMRSHTYLPTRTFELVVHSSDIAQAAGVSYEPPAAALAEATELVRGLALAQGHGLALVRRLTGRESGAELPGSVL
ncbi:maleylpyruvate isomerase N-terminal domain-containing protein [Gulosibacter massiliensis]|uniref:maleylpyruvate isomerase N-terminal domain-containing protein n=1 Tax=Gulosibacter massiliensis TaxID=2479839 RepID=UPI000F63E19E|nr:maleylpyruvate isomerase N-terminal domain-containing protein [Gulosibacter massiliensis]